MRAGMRWASSGVVVIVLGCGGARPEAESADDDGTASFEHMESAGDAPAQKPDFDALGKREAAGLQKQKVDGPGKSFRAEIAAVAAPTVESKDGTTVVTAPMGTGAPLHCEVFAEDLDAAGSIAGLLASVSQGVTLRRVQPWDVKVARDAPTLYVRAVYTKGAEGGAALGELKIAMHTGNGRPALCVHDEIGYEQTFLDATQAFFESIEHAKAPPRPDYLDVATVRLDDRLVGFAVTTLQKEGKERVLREASSLMLPASEKEVHFTDDFAVQFLDARGQVKRGVWAQGVAGTLELKMELERGAGGAYRYAGVVHGKQVKGEFKVAGAEGLSTSVALAPRLLRAAKPGALDFTAQSYSPGTDPVQPITVKYSRDGKDPPGNVHLALGKTEATGHVDPNGLMDELTIAMGARALRFHREVSHGKP